MFFGTPHEGMRTWDLEDMVDTESARNETVTSRHILLKLLNEGSEFLEVQKDTLRHILGECKIKIVSFYETEKTQTVKRVRGLFSVTPEAGIWGHWTKLNSFSQLLAHM